jgi:hypothetical protein
MTSTSEMGVLDKEVEYLLFEIFKLNFAIDNDLRIRLSDRDTQDFLKQQGKLLLTNISSLVNRIEAFVGGNDVIQSMIEDKDEIKKMVLFLRDEVNSVKTQYSKGW